MAPRALVGLGRLMNRVLRGAGLELHRVTAPTERLNALGALARLATTQLREVRTVIDVGASDGRWSRSAMRYLADARYLLIEANDVHAHALMTFARADSRVRFAIAAAADTDTQVYFDGSDPFGGLASHEPGGHDRMVPARTVDGLVRAEGLPGPYLLKLDTHGFEVPILRGASEVLKSAALVVIETYNFRPVPDALRFPEMCAFMEERGFSVIDISDVLHRPRDNALWQFDLYFAPSAAPVFSSGSYR